MKFKREEGELYSPLEEDVVAGRTPRQATLALKAKKVRSFIAKNPGCSSLQIKEALRSSSMNSTLVQPSNVLCGICANLIPGVTAKSSGLMTALNYPERWDDDLEALLCDDCSYQAKAAGAWLKHAQLKTCTKTRGK